MNAFSPRLRVLRDERDWAAAPHSLFGLTLIAGLLGGWWTPALYLTSLAGTCWLVAKTRGAKSFANRHARESLNLQFSFLLVWIGAYVVNRLNPGPDNPPFLIVVVLGAYIAAFSQTWSASNRASKGLDSRFKIAIRFLR